MAQRHVARSLILQVLFALDFISREETQIRELVRYCADEFGSGFGDYNFVESIILGVQKKKHILDEIIEKAAPKWPIEVMSPIDRNILRMGLYELVFGNYEQVPPKVAINEAVEIAKSFGTDSSRRFINGVLGTVYKEIGEPGKDQESTKQELTPEEYALLPIEQKAGSIVYAIHGGGISLAMVHDVFGYWTLPKGTVDPTEEPTDTAVRKILEEIGVAARIIAKLGENEYVANHPERGRIRKHVHYFLAKSEYTPLTLHSESGGLVDAKWFPVAEVVNLRMYEDVTKLITVSLDFILSQQINESEQHH